MYELIQVSELCYYIQCPAKIGVVKTDENNVVLIEACPKRSEQKVRHDGSKCGTLRLMNSPVCRRKGARHVLQ